MSQQINLYNAAFKPKRRLLTAKRLAIAAGSLLAVVAAAAGLSFQQAAAKSAEAAEVQAALKVAQDKLNEVIRESAARKPSPELQAEIDRLRSLMAMRDEVLAVVGKGLGDPSGGKGGGFGDYLRGLARQSQDGLWLTAFGVEAGGVNMSLSGRTVDKSLLPGYVRRLNSEKVFSGKSFSGLNMEYKDGSGKAAAVTPAPTSAARPDPTGRYIEFNLVAADAVAKAVAAAAPEAKP